MEANGRRKVAVPTVLTTAPDVLEAFRNEKEYQDLVNVGVILSYICPLMYMNNPICQKVPTITSSNKLRTYTSARYYKDAELLEIITGGRN